MRKIYVVQHCQSEHHVNGMSGGWTDTPLTDLGRRQADALAKRMEWELDLNEPFTVFSSDLKRANETAEIICKHLDLPHQTNENLREINTGVAAGKTREWANAHMNKRRSDTYEIDYLMFDGGETVRMFYTRTVACMESIVHQNEENLIIVTHGGTLGCIVNWWMKGGVERLAEVQYAARPGSLSLLTYSRFKQRKLSLLNDTAHLKAL